MKKKILKIFLIFSVLLSILFLNIQPTYASKMDEIFGGAQNFIQQGNPENAMSKEKIQAMSSILYNVLFVIAICVAVGIGIYIGIQFMTSGVEQKAKIKETLIAYVAGCIVVFGSFTIWKLVVTILQSAV